MRVNLDTVVLNARDDSGAWSDVCELPRWVESSRKRARSMSRFVTGSGRIIGRGLAVVPQEWSLSVVGCDKTVVDWVEDRIGVLLCARDPEGRKMVGTVDAVDSTKHKAYGQLWNVSFTLTEVTFSEAV